ncbi:hypothetical protein Tco_1443993 [Tanacetum coccineum]
MQKPKGSDDYYQILDFLGASHIRSPELGPPAILATIDATPYTITEDSVRGQLQLAYTLEWIILDMSLKASEGAGVVAPTIPQIIPELIPEPMPETDQPQDHLTAPQDNKL